MRYGNIMTSRDVDIFILACRTRVSIEMRRSDRLIAGRRALAPQADSTGTAADDAYRTQERLDQEARIRNQRAVEQREQTAQEAAVKQAEDERVRKGVENYFSTGFLPRVSDDTAQNHALNERIRAAIHVAAGNPNSPQRTQLVAEQKEKDVDSRLTYYHTHMPSQWSEDHRQYRIDEWKARNYKSMTRAEWYAALYSDTEGTPYYALNSISGVIPAKPDGKNPLEETMYYDQILPWAGARLDWSEDQWFVTHELSYIQQVERSAMLSRNPSFSVRFSTWKGLKNAPDLDTFSYTALFLGALVALAAIVIKT